MNISISIQDVCLLNTQTYAKIHTLIYLLFVYFQVFKSKSTSYFFEPSNGIISSIVTLTIYHHRRCARMCPQVGKFADLSLINRFSKHMREIDGEKERKKISFAWIVNQWVTLILFHHMPSDYWIIFELVAFLCRFMFDSFFFQSFALFINFFTSELEHFFIARFFSASLFNDLHSECI